MKLLSKETNDLKEKSMQMMWDKGIREAKFYSYLEDIKKNSSIMQEIFNIREGKK